MNRREQPASGVLDVAQNQHHAVPGPWHQRLLDQAHGLSPIRTAVVYPVDQNALLGAIEAAQANLIVPLLVGPEERIRAAAHTANIDLTPYSIVPTEQSHEAAEQAVALIRAGKADALMKGSLHTDEFMR